MYLLCVCKRVAVFTVMWRPTQGAGPLLPPGRFLGYQAWQQVLCRPSHLTGPVLSCWKPLPWIQYAFSQVSFDALQSGLCVLRSWWEAAWFLGRLCARGQKTSLKDRESQINSMYPELTMPCHFTKCCRMPGRNRTCQGLDSTQGHLMAPLASSPLPPKHIRCSNIRLE